MDFVRKILSHVFSCENMTLNAMQYQNVSYMVLLCR